MFMYKQKSDRGAKGQREAMRMAMRTVEKNEAEGKWSDVRGSRIRREQDEERTGYKEELEKTSEGWREKKRERGGGGETEKENTRDAAEKGVEEEVARRRMKEVGIVWRRNL